jgi:hypothetical protein
MITALLRGPPGPPEQRVGGSMNVLVPLSAVAGLAVPPVAITDGSADPVWVDVPSRGGWLYGRAPTLRLPFDPAAAAVVQHWLRHQRRRRAVVAPVLLTLLLAALATFRLDAHSWVFPVLLAVNAAIALRAAHVEKRTTLAQHPELVGRLGCYLPALPDAVARAWLVRNPEVQVVTGRPRHRRFASPVYRWAAGACAVAAAGIWWYALRDGESGLVPLAAFVVLLGAAVVAAGKALPVGFVRLGDAPR